MSRVVIGVFNEKDRAESALQELKAKGYERDLSLVARDEEKSMDSGAASFGDQNLAEGTYTGGALGGIAGLLAGVGALLIPGIGPIVAAGPIAATLTGVVGGGLAGGLIDYGIPEERGEYYEEQVRRGGILVSVKSSDERIDEAASILRHYGASDVETHSS